MRIIFMGTPDFAVPSLKILVEHDYNVVGVITAPDKPAGRGLKISETAVKQYAQSVGLKILQPANLKSEDFQNELKSLNADLQIVVAFRMLPETVWNMPRLGSFNLHASLLPDYRGAAPINWAIINGERETGVTTFFIEKEIDTGNIIFQEKVKIRDDETAGELHDKLMYVGATLVLKTVKAIEKNEAPHVKQSAASNKIAPKIFRENCKIDWNKSTAEVYNFIRGLSPYPAAWTLLDGKVFKIFKADKTLETVETPGKFFFSPVFKISTADGFIFPKDVQLEGKKAMSAEEFLRGYNP